MKDNEDLENNGVHFSHTQTFDEHENEMAQNQILKASLNQSKVEGS